MSTKTGEKGKKPTGNRAVKNQMHETKPNSRKRLPRKQNPVVLYSPGIRKPRGRASGQPQQGQPLGRSEGVTGQLLQEARTGAAGQRDGSRAVRTV